MGKRTGTPGTPKKEPAWWEPFLAALASSGNVLVACRAARVARRTAYNHRDRCPRFARRWESALEEATDVLEAEAWRRAAKGVDEPVFHQGKQVATVKKYSDTLLIFLLKGNNPAKFAGLDEKRLAQLIADAVAAQQPAAAPAKGSGKGA